MSAPEGLVAICDDDDALADALVDHVRRQGGSALLVDLRFHRPSLAIGEGRTEVRHLGRVVRPAVVLDRTSTSSLGMPAAAAVARRGSSLFDEGYAAAREEQGLVLAVLATFARHGAMVVDPVGIFDRFLQPERWRRLLRDGGVVHGEGPADVQALLAGGRVLHAVRAGHRFELAEDERATVELAGRLLGLTLGRVDLALGPDGSATVTGWHPRPLRSAAIAATVVAAMAAAIGADGATPDRHPRSDGLFVPDLVANLRPRVP